MAVDSLWPETVLCILCPCALVRTNSNKRQQIIAKAGETVFAEKEYTQLATQLAETKLSARFFGVWGIYTLKLECP